MPCDCSHLEPTEHEKESVRLAKYIRYIHQKMKELGWQFTREDMAWQKWANDTHAKYYGDKSKVHKATDYLCTLLGNTLDKNDIEYTVYDAHDRLARELANWWEDHQEADEKKREQNKPPITESETDETVTVNGTTFNVYNVLSKEYPDSVIKKFNKSQQALLATEIVKEMMG